MNDDSLMIVVPHHIVYHYTVMFSLTNVPKYLIINVVSLWLGIWTMSSILPLRIVDVDDT